MTCSQLLNIIFLLSALARFVDLLGEQVLLQLRLLLVQGRAVERLVV